MNDKDQKAFDPKLDRKEDSAVTGKGAVELTEGDLAGVSGGATGKHISKATLT